LCAACVLKRALFSRKELSPRGGTNLSLKLKKRPLGESAKNWLSVRKIFVGKKGEGIFFFFPPQEEKGGGNAGDKYSPPLSSEKRTTPPLGEERTRGALSLPSPINRRQQESWWVIS